jgi:hypothetical protein
MSWTIGLAAMLTVVGGCATVDSVSTRRLIEHRAMVDLSGLGPLTRYDDVQAQAAVPRTWQPSRVKNAPLYTDMHWRSPSGRTGVGIVYIRTPLPLRPGLLIWLAQREYARRADDGRMLARWSDSAGREWFEAQNSRYHIRGCAMVSGTNAWIIYSGRKSGEAPDAAELGLAWRCLQTVIPQPLASPPTEAQAADDAPPGAGRS